MANSISIDPLTRIEGHLAIRLEVEEGRVKDAYCSGEMFRGFESILKGRDPLDAQQITQRICGVCPISHGTASVLAQEDAYHLQPTENGRLLRNLILGANYIQSHIIHFYHLSALDFIDIQAVLDYTGSDPFLIDLRDWVRSQLNSGQALPAAPFLPRYEGAYVSDFNANLQAIRHYGDALTMRRTAHEMAAIFCGKIPHSPALVPGGVTSRPEAREIAAYSSKLQQLLRFISDCYIPDVLNVAAAFPEYLREGRGCGSFLSFGVFKESNGETFLPAGVLDQDEMKEPDLKAIREDVRHSLFSSPSGLHPSSGRTEPVANKEGAYSWLKAPRYDGKPMEVGPLARLLVAHQKDPNSVAGQAVERFLTDMKLNRSDLDSVLGRHAARAIECRLVAEQCQRWLDQVKPDEPGARAFKTPSSGEGVGMTEAPRGALGHWITVKNKRIEHYECVVPTTWNCSPRDDDGVPGPVEQSLAGTAVADPENPLEATRVVRAFDPCIACAVH